MVGNYIVSFIGFLPANDPQVVVYIAVDNAKGTSQFGGTIAGPMAKSILEDAIDIMNIEKPIGASEKKYNYLDKKYVEVSNVVGMNIKEAVKNLKSFKVELTGLGDNVLYQSPSAGERITEGNSIRLYLGKG